MSYPRCQTPSGNLHCTVEHFFWEFGILIDHNAIEDNLGCFLYKPLRDEETIAVLHIVGAATHCKIHI